MQNYGNMQDLLHSQRRRRDRRRWLLRIVFLIAALGAGGYTWWHYLSDGKSAKRQRDVAVEQGRALVHRSLEAAHRPLEVDAPAPEQQTENEAWKASWTEGQPVKMRGKLERHQSVFEALQDREVPPDKIQAVVSATSESFDFRKSRPGDEWSAEVEASGATVSRPPPGRPVARRSLGRS